MSEKFQDIGCVHPGEYEPDGLVAGDPCGGCGWKEAQRGLWNQVRAQLLIGFGEIFTLLRIALEFIA